MSKKNKWVLPSGALERPFCHICSLAPDEPTFKKVNAALAIGRAILI